MKVAVALAFAAATGMALLGCSKQLPAADLPTLPMPAGQVIPALSKAGFDCHLNYGDSPFYVCRDAGMSAEPFTPFISVDIANGIDATSSVSCFDGENPTVDEYPGLAYPVVLAKDFEAAWVPSNDQMGDAAAVAAVVKEAQAPMAHVAEVLGLEATTIAAACGLDVSTAMPSSSKAQ